MKKLFFTNLFLLLLGIPALLCALPVAFIVLVARAGYSLAMEIESLYKQNTL